MSDTRAPIDLQLDPRSVELMKRLRRHAKYVSLKNSMRVIGISYRKEVGKIFNRTQVRDPSLRWDQLKPKTKAQKERLGYGDKGILVRKGDLKKSMTKVGAEGNISKYGHDFGFFGTDIGAEGDKPSYGVYHDNLDEPRHKIPLRNFSQPSESTYGSWLNTIDRDLEGQLRRIGVSTT